MTRDPHLCEVCFERPIWSDAVAHGYRWCEECSYSTECGNPDCRMHWEVAPHLAWETGALCERCQADADWCQWLRSTLDAVERIAGEHGWQLDRDSYSGGFNTRSRYYTLNRGDEEVKLRVSDHGDCYCNDDLSLAMRPSGDDTTIEGVEERLSREGPSR